MRGKLANEMIPVRSEEYRRICFAVDGKLDRSAFDSLGYEFDTYYIFIGTILYPWILKAILSIRKARSVRDCILGGTVPQPTF